MQQHRWVPIDGSHQEPLQGDLVLRNGEYVSEHDTFMKLEGVFITATGRLQAVVTPKNRIQVSLEQQDLDLHTADYRCEPTVQQIVPLHCSTVTLLHFGVMHFRVQPPPLASKVMLKTRDALLCAGVGLL